MGSKEYDIQDEHQGSIIKSNFTINRIKERCSPNASIADTKLSISLPLGIELLVRFGTRRPGIVDIHVSTPAFQTYRLLGVRLQLKLPSSPLDLHYQACNFGCESDHPIVPPAFPHPILNATYEDSQANYRYIRNNVVGFEEIEEMDELKCLFQGTLGVEEPSLPVVRCGDTLRLLKEHQATDVEIVVGETTFRAHKWVLATKSEYFRAFFDFETKIDEARVGKIVIGDVDAEMFDVLLEFLYSGNPPTNLGNIVLKLLPVADRFGVETLLKYCGFAIKEYCGQVLYARVHPSRSISVDLDFCLAALVLSIHHNVDDVKEVCMDGFLAWNASDFLVDDPRYSFIDGKLRRELINRFCSEERFPRVLHGDVFSALKVADRYGCEEGKKKCLLFYKTNPNKLQSQFKKLENTSTLNRDLLDAVLERTDDLDADYRGNHIDEKDETVCGPPLFSKLDETYQRDVIDQSCTEERLKGASPSTVLEALETADRLGCKAGKNNCLLVFKKNLRKIAEAESFKELKRNSPLNRYLLEAFFDRRDEKDRRFFFNMC